MNKKRWHNLGWFAAGTLLGSFVLSFLGGILGSVAGKR